MLMVNIDIGWSDPWHDLDESYPVIYWKAWVNGNKYGQFWVVREELTKDIIQKWYDFAVEDAEKSLASLDTDAQS